MPVDVTTQTLIPKPTAEVAAFATEPENATRWYKNIKKAEWVSTPPIALGSRFRFTAQFLGRRMTYTYEVTDYEPGHRLTMRTAEGPFPMETTYVFEPVDGATRMTLRNRGDPQGFSKVVAPLLERAMRKANEEDLRRLSKVLTAGVGRPESGATAGTSRETA